MNVCLVYDCLFPYNIGGAERWFRTLATELAQQGHRVTYLTRDQWPADEPPQIPGVEVIAVAPGGELYGKGGRRRSWPPVRFGIGVFRHLLRHGRRTCYARRPNCRGCALRRMCPSADTFG